MSSAPPSRARRPTPTVVVSGDVTVDWNLARRAPRESGGGWHRDLGARSSCQRGGAALLADLTRAALGGPGSGGSDPRVLDPDTAAERMSPDEERSSHSYAIWTPSEVRRGGRGRVWRVEQSIGLDRARTDAAVREEWERLALELPKADVIVLDDEDLGFRDHSDPGLWARVADGGQDPWMLLKTSRPVARGPLWEHLREHCPQRLVTLMTINDLRGGDVWVSRELSWERTAQDLFWELVHNPLVNGLSRCAHSVFSFGAAGALLLTGSPADTEPVAPRLTLLFDPEEIEGTWESERPGAMIGTTTCLAASLARELATAPEEPDLVQAIGSGVGALRRLWDQGYGNADEGMEIAFPFAAVAEQIVAGSNSLARAAVADPSRLALAPESESEPNGGHGVAGGRSTLGVTAERDTAGADRHWTILEDRYRGDLLGVAEEVVRHGPEIALKDVPLGQFGKLLTVDRGEIESLRAVQTLIAEYCRSSLPKPLSIGVFGAPGSGKSFVMVQLAQLVGAERISDKIDFNLSQFGSIEDLHDAFHQVRDVRLSGAIPLVCWDEFDASFQGEELGWLRYFLAPMEDGVFRQGQVLHPIGRAIFVFAGGTSDRLERFGLGVDEDAFRSCKGPDFVSRLKGYVNVLGCNPREDEPDPHHLVRRAIWLRKLLEREAPRLFDRGGVLRIDRGVLRAFLETRRYGHGGRSMEAIVTASYLSGETSYQRSSLPSATQLDLHVDGREFLSLVQRIDLEGDLLELLAEATHEIYCEDLRERQAPSSGLVPWRELPEHLKEQNRAAVRDIPEKLAQINHVMIPARGEDARPDFPTETEEALARHEHERFVRAKLEEGWRPGPEEDERMKIDPSLVPWEELPEDERDKDRAQVRGIPRILARAGYAVVRCSRESDFSSSRNRRSN